jgi:hypothetical protein
VDLDGPAEPVLLVGERGAVGMGHPGAVAVAVAVVETGEGAALAAHGRRCGDEPPEPVKLEPRANLGPATSRSAMA